jgi:hypothetical protein
MVTTEIARLKEEKPMTRDKKMEIGEQPEKIQLGKITLTPLTVVWIIAMIVTVVGIMLKVVVPYISPICWIVTGAGFIWWIANMIWGQ